MSIFSDEAKAKVIPPDPDDDRGLPMEVRIHMVHATYDMFYSKLFGSPPPEDFVWDRSATDAVGHAYHRRISFKELRKEAASDEEFLADFFSGGLRETLDARSKEIHDLPLEERRARVKSILRA